MLMTSHSPSPSPSSGSSPEQLGLKLELGQRIFINNGINKNVKRVKCLNVFGRLCMLGLCKSFVGLRRSIILQML